MSLFILIQFFITAIYACIILYFVYHWINIPTFKPDLKWVCETSVTIIIPARNEENVIGQLLLDILSQDYPGNLVEVIVVDDHSTDNTYDEVINFRSEHPDLKIEVMKNQLGERNNMYKKSAITLAVNQARGSLIITTDADCRVDKHWLFSFASYYEQSKARFISGPVIFSRENTFFEKLQEIEFTGLIGVGAASIHAEIPMICNGANIAYERKAFLDSEGYLKCREAIVSTNPQKNIFDFFHQRKRWASKVNNYTSPYALFVAVFLFLVNLSLLSGMVFSVYDPSYLKILVCLFLLKCVPDFIFVYRIEEFFNRKKLLYLFLPGQILNIFYITIVASVAPFGRYVWKGRKVR
jgi:glycosyltransferase involved in cell wall biosynthesis